MRLPSTPKRKDEGGVQNGELLLRSVLLASALRTIVEDGPGGLKTLLTLELEGNGLLHAGVTLPNVRRFGFGVEVVNESVKAAISCNSLLGSSKAYLNHNC